MKGINYITNETGTKTGIVINFQEINPSIENFTDRFMSEIKLLIYKYSAEKPESNAAGIYTIEGNKMSKKEFADYLLLLSNSVKNGSAKTYTQQEVENLIDKW
jgi:hypothetical protein